MSQPSTNGGTDTLRYRLDSSWRRPNNGNTVIAGSPLRLFRLTDSGAQFIADVEADVAISPTPAHQQLLDRFVDAGALHPVPRAGPFSIADVTIVVPAHNRLPTWTAAQTIVVDDGSNPPLAHATVRHASNRGPGAARNTGLAEVTTPLVAFVDTDVLLCDDWLTPLLAHFADDRVALVAPRVASAPGATSLAGYEQRHSPLDLGGEPARVAPGTRVAYVPAAAIVCRTDAVRELSGFDERLRTGEDVDLVWRLCAAGHRCRYEPNSIVFHAPRASIAALVEQRFGFGRSATPLAARHPGALAPVRMNVWSAVVWALALARRPWLALGVLAGTIVALHRKLNEKRHDKPHDKLHDLPLVESARLAGLGTLGAGRQLADATASVWWPITAALAAVSRRRRLPIAVALIAPAAAAAMRQRSAQPLVDWPVQLLDRMAYGAGVWAGAVSARDFAALTPKISAHSAQTDSGTRPQRIN